jgi:hypothetical protein
LLVTGSWQRLIKRFERRVVEKSRYDKVAGGSRSKRLLGVNESLEALATLRLHTV